MGEAVRAAHFKWTGAHREACVGQQVHDSKDGSGRDSGSKCRGCLGEHAREQLQGIAQEGFALRNGRQGDGGRCRSVHSPSRLLHWALGCLVLRCRFRRRGSPHMYAREAGNCSRTPWRQCTWLAHEAQQFSQICKTHEDSLSHDKGGGSIIARYPGRSKCLVTVCQALAWVRAVMLSHTGHELPQACAQLAVRIMVC